MDETACSKLRAKRRSIIAAGSNLLKLHSAIGAAHSGHAMWAAPISKRASACFTMQFVQYQPCLQPNRTAPPFSNSSQHIAHTSAVELYFIWARGLVPGVMLSRFDTLSDRGLLKSDFADRAANSPTLAALEDDGL
jgi:hypothetical protein